MEPVNTPLPHPQVTSAEAAKAAVLSDGEQRCACLQAHVLLRLAGGYGGVSPPPPLPQNLPCLELRSFVLGNVGLLRMTATPSPGLVFSAMLANCA
jgi:hypothetical protein